MTADQADLAAIYHRSRRDPVWFVENVLHLGTWSAQRDILESVRDHQRTTVATMNGVGKSKAIGGMLIPWYLTCFENSRIIATSPTKRQLGHMWIEFGRSRKSSEIPWPAGGKESPYFEYKLSDEWFFQGYTTSSTEPDKFAGHHEENILFIVEEASGVNEAIYEAIEGSLNTPGAKLIMVGNPLEIGGQFYRSVHGARSERESYNVIQIGRDDLPWATGEDCPPDVVAKLSSKAWCDQRLEVWGADDPRYEARVLGRYPRGGAWTVIPLQLVETAQGRTCEHGKPIVVSCDVARYGDDKTVICLRRGNHVRITDVISGQDTTATSDLIGAYGTAYGNRQGRCRIVVDDSGVGGGVVDQLRRQGYQVDAFNGAEAPIVEKDVDGFPTYPNRRSESWFSFRDAIGQLDLDPDPLLATELATPKYKSEGKGRMVEPKDKTKEILGRSPDRADAVLMAFAPSKDRTVTTQDARL